MNLPKVTQLAWFTGLLTFVCTAILGQAELVGEPWRHYISVFAIIGTAITGYMIQHPWDGIDRRNDDRRRDDRIINEINKENNK